MDITQRLTEWVNHAGNDPIAAATPDIVDAKREIERLRLALRRVNSWNDHPGRFSAELQEILDDVIDTSNVKFQ